jgi:hypothetical protein
MRCVFFRLAWLLLILPAAARENGLDARIGKALISISR